MCFINFGKIFIFLFNELIRTPSMIENELNKTISTNKVMSHNNIEATLNLEEKEVSNRTLQFGSIGMLVGILIAIINLVRGINISAILIFLFVIVLGIILLLAKKKITKHIIPAIIITTDFFLVLICFAEGLDTNGYLFILPVMFAITFLLGHTKEKKAVVISYLFITTISFCICVFLSDKKSNWQNIPLDITLQMGKSNSFFVVALCTCFAYLGIYHERKYIAVINNEKNTIGLQKEKLRQQNVNLKEIAFMSAHNLRAPLTNILALVNLIDINQLENEDDKVIITHIQTSAQKLDEVIHGIVAKTYTNISN